MAEEIAKEREELQAAATTDLVNKLAATGWGLFFVWIGLAFLVDAGVGVTLLGIGIITLCMQLARKWFELKFEGIWLIIGLLLLIGGVWEMLAVQLPLMPVLLIVAGLALLFSILRGKESGKKESY
jgi:hypothetical protein